MIIDALPYADVVPTPEQTAAAKALIAAEKADTTEMHPDVPPMPCCPVTDRYAAYDKIERVAPSKCPATLLEHEVTRHGNLTILLEQGKASWLRHNDGIDGHRLVIEGATAVVGVRVKDVNAKRKREQVEALAVMESKNEEWRSLLAKCAAVRTATTALQKH